MTVAFGSLRNAKVRRKQPLDELLCTWVLFDSEAEGHVSEGKSWRIMQGRIYW